MSVQLITDVSAVRQALETHPCVVIDFMAEWCGPCKAIAPKMSTLAETYSAIKFLKVDVDQMEMNFIQSENVSSMPTIKFYKDGQCIDHLTVVGPNLNKVQTSVRELNHLLS